MARYEDLLASGVVITGGSTLLSGMPELAEEVIGLPVRRGMPRGIGGLVEADAAEIRDLIAIFHRWRDEADAAFLYRVLANLEHDPERRRTFEELREVVDFLRDPKKYEALGAEIRYYPDDKFRFPQVGKVKFDSTKDLTTENTEHTEKGKTG